MKLKYLLIVVFILLSALPLFAGLQYLNQQSGNYYREQVKSHLSALSLIAKKRVLTAVDRIRDNTALVSSRTQMRISLDKWNNDKDQTSLGKVSRIINDAKLGLGHLSEIEVYDQAGVLVASTTSVEPENTIEPASFSKSKITLVKDGEFVLAHSTAPLILNHEIVGYIRLSFFTEFIEDLVRERDGLGETGEWLFAVRDDNGDAVFAVPLRYDHKAAFTRRVLKDRTDVPITQALLGNEIVMSHAPDYRDQPVLASTRYISELDWGLVAKINEDEVSAMVNRNVTLIYLTEFIIVVLAIGAGILLSVFISGPIEKLKRYTQSVAGGSYDLPPDVEGWQEAKELTSHFAYMVKALREMNENLNAKVEERTQELEEANEKLTLLSSQDPLTGLFNRRYFDEHFELEFKRATRYGHGLAVVTLDIDHFKSVNDTYGHDAGDLVLKKLAEYLQGGVRETDILARTGGEEFCLLLPETQEASCLAFLERLRADIAEIQLPLQPSPIQVTCSFGVSFHDEKSESPEDLLKQADLALYHAKETGRNRVVSYSAGMEAQR